MIPYLFDDIYRLKPVICSTYEEINKKWYIAKPITLLSLYEIYKRLYHCYLILTNKAFAVSYAKDWLKLIK